MKHKSKDGAPASAIELAIGVLRDAKNDVSTADSALERALADLRAAPRADKVAISTVLEAALERLRAARSKVDEAERTLAAEQASST